MNEFDPAQRARTTLRCAVYTRKSSEEGLDMAFNSLDAQREAGLDYIKSQKLQGWTAIPSSYDDGGFSGGSVDRPGLQRLLEDIARGRVDVVVVYKVDRLSRSLADFARLMQTFDQHNVSFVSVTQQFNTTTSMGRLTLNMLLSFAQFEREVTGERIRDKIAATKRKGVWVGGQPPLGYRLPKEGDTGFTAGDRVLRIVEPEAALVRSIYSGYLELGSLVQLAARLNREGHTTRRWNSGVGRRHGGRPLTAAYLHRVLTNPIYTGHITHERRHGRGAGPPQIDVHPGQHAPIIEKALWEGVRGRMQAVQRDTTHRWTHTHLLQGKIRTCEDHAMSPGSVQRPVSKRPGTPSHGPGSKRLVRYYISQKAIKQGYRTCAIRSVNAAFVDDLVRGMVLDYLRQQKGLDLRELDVPTRDHWVREMIIRAVLAPDAITVDVMDDRVADCAAAVRSLSGRQRKNERLAARAFGDATPSCVLKPAVEQHQTFTRLMLATEIKQRDGKRMIVGPQGDDLFRALSRSGEPVRREHLVEAIGLAFAWHRELLNEGASIRSIARAYGLVHGRVHALLPLAQLGPGALRAVLTGEIGKQISVLDLLRAAQGLEWGRQARGLGTVAE